MAIVSLQRALLLAGAVLPFARQGLAQTILTEEGQVIAANEITVAPAAEVVETESGVLQLTDAVIANLTAHELSDIELFMFDDSEETAAAKVKRSYTNVGDCKVMPGDRKWPSRLTWGIFNLLTGGALIETVPIGAVCYKNSGVYNAAKCAQIIANWTQSATHANDPTSVMSPLYTGETCMPADGAITGSTCTLGGFPSYAVKATNVFQVQLAVNLARNLGLRLVVKNTGHDFLGKSTGAGALSIWTHNLKDISYIKSIKTPSYTGPAMELGAGVQVGEMYAAANKFGVTAVGGECKGVGVAGGYLAGGGHSPLSGKFGLGSDQVLSLNVVLPNGRFVTVSEKQNPDLFFAMRGGGGSTYGVVTSLTVKVYPKMKFSGVTWSISSGASTNNTDELFWQAMYAYWRHFPDYASKGSYGYSTLFPTGAGYAWSMLPWLVPGMALADFKAMVAPLFAEWTALGFDFTPTFFEHDNFYETWSTHFPTEAVANSNLRTASRLYPRDAWTNETKREAMFDTVRGVVEEGSALIQYNMNPVAPANTPASGANSHWRDAVWFGIMGTGWAPGLAGVELEAVQRKITDDWMGRLRVYGPGGYGNEGDAMEPDFAEAFYGTNYARLLEIKRKVDPYDVFWAQTAVGSERWKIQGQPSWLVLQTNKLCKVAN